MDLTVFGLPKELLVHHGRAGGRWCLEGRNGVVGDAVVGNDVVGGHVVVIRQARI